MWTLVILLNAPVGKIGDFGLALNQIEVVVLHISRPISVWAFLWRGRYSKECAEIRIYLFSVVRFRNILLLPYSLLPLGHQPSSLAKSLQTQRPALTGRR